ncbi:MAG: hypothetical protein IKS31_09085 [Clostridia bacterium]|nr:hypothetical protein [Clostridia bacterium]
MDLALAYRQVSERVAKLDFAALYRGFSPFPFALYDDTKAYTDGGYFERPDSFMGNTSVLWNGAHTAIWKLGREDWDWDVLASKLVHEMLHAFQNASGETRWADERSALVKYGCDAVSLTARLAEAACMRACLTADVPETFSRLLSLRRARMERFPDAYDYEARTEQIEGSAHHVELAALAQLSPDKARERWTQLFDALEAPARYFPVRPVTYLSGAAMIACLRRYTRLDTDAPGDIPFSVAALSDAKPCDLPPADPRVEACLRERQAQIRDTVVRTLEKGDPVLDGAYRLIAWNVYDAVRDGRYAVINGFLGYLEGTDLPGTDAELFSLMKTLSGDFVAEIDRDLRLYRVWRR